MSHRYQDQRGWGGNHGRGRGHNRGRGHGGWQQESPSSGPQNRDRRSQRVHSPSGQQWNQEGFDEWNQRQSQEEFSQDIGKSDGSQGHQRRIFGNENVTGQREQASWSEDHRMQSHPNSSDMNHGGPSEGMLRDDQQGHSTQGRSQSDQPFMQKPFIRPPYTDQTMSGHHQPLMQPFNQNLQSPMPRFPGANLHQTGPAPQMQSGQITMQHQVADGQNVQSNRNNQPHPYQHGPDRTPHQQMMPGNSAAMNAEQNFHLHNPSTVPLELLQHQTRPAPQMYTTGDVKMERNVDKDWVDQFLKGIRQVSGLPGIDGKGILMPISEGKRILREYLLLLKKLEECRDSLATSMDSDEAAWQHECNVANQIKGKLTETQQKLEDASFVPRLMQRITKTKKRRESIGRRKKRAFMEREAEQERIRRVTEKIDAKVAKEQKAIEDAKNEAALQKEADSTLFEVRSKKKDADKTLEMLRALRKLRNVRKEAASRKGSYSSSVSDKSFEESVQKLEELMNKARTTYRDEEQTLLVMLEHEQEENKEKQLEILRRRQKKSALKAVQKRKEAFFGKDEPVGPEDSLFPFQQFYSIAEHNLQALVGIRRQWDQFLVPPGDPQGSGIPDDWVLPSEPSSKEWASALQDT